MKCKDARSIALLHCVASGLATALTVPAACATLGDLPMPVVLVSAAALPAGLGIDPDHLPYTVQRATEAVRHASGSDEVSDFMARRLTGVNVNEVQGNALQNDLSFRGFRLSPTLGAAQGMSVYLDGVRANEPFGDVMNWDMLPQAAIADVMLVAGANPLFGLNTLGGTLAFTTMSGRSHPGTRVDMSLASHDRKRIDLSWGRRRDDGRHGFVAATLFEEAGWRAHSGGGLGNLFVKVGQYGGANSWDLSFLYGRSHLHGNGLLPSSDAPGNSGLYELDRSAAYTYPDITRNRLTQLTLNTRNAIDDDSELALTAYLRGSRRDTLNADVNADYSDYVDACADGFDSAGSPLSPASCSYDRSAASALHSAALNTSVTHQRSAGATLNFTRDSQGHQFLLGAALDASKVDYSQSAQDGWFAADRGVVADPQSPDIRTAAVDGRSLALGVYASDTWQLSRDTFLTASGRFNRTVVDNTLAGQAPEHFTYQRLNPAIGLVQRVGSGVALFANLADSNRVPTVIELGCADPQQPCRLPVGLQSDPYLKQVVSRTMEAGMRWQSSPVLSGVVSLYRSVNRDDILFFTAGASQQGYFANFERTRRQGADLSTKFRHGSVDATLSYSFLDATYDAAGMLFVGQRSVGVAPGMPIAGLPRHTLKLNLDWHASPRTTVGADVVAVSSMATQGNEDGLSADPVNGIAARRADWSIRGHATLALHASHRLEKGWEVFGRITNLFDRRHETWGAVARGLFPGGVLLQPHVEASDPANVRFIAPGAPRAISIGLRYRM
jgi:hypothetical protein